MATRLSDQAVKALLPPMARSQVTWDSAVKGFGVCVTATGRKSFVLNYRRKADGRERRIVVGAFPDWGTSAARDEAKRLKREVDTGGDPLGALQTGRAAPTVADLCARFIDEYLPRKRPWTQKGYRQQIDADILPALGRLKVTSVTFDDIDELHRGISRRAPYHANRVAALASRIFSMAIKWRMRTDNPCKGVERNPEHQRRRYLSPDELARLAEALTALRDQQSANIIRLLTLTGSRRGETLQARWADVDLEASIWNKPGSTTKQRTAHTVPLSDAARRLLLDVRDHVPIKSEWVFPGVNEAPRRDVKDAWAAACKAAGIKGARLHDLRHTFASVLASSGKSLPLIGALLGHSTPVTTARYSHLFDDPLREATEHASAIITGAKSAEVVPVPNRRRG
jgi:integrase